MIHGSLKDIPANREFDSVVCINVLEHIENDAEEIQNAARMLKSGGTLIVRAPLHHWLFTPFDEAIGHFRRYSARTLEAIRPEVLRERSTIYLDSVGVLASAGNRLFLRSASPSQKQIQFWDKFLVRISLGLDKVLRYRVGNTIVVVWEKCE